MVVMEQEREHPAPPYEPQKLAAPEPRQKAMITINNVDFCYGANQVLYDVNLEIPPPCGHGVHRTVWLWQNHPAALFQSHERSD
jgi:hypothetical protein